MSPKSRKGLARGKRSPARGTRTGARGYFLHNPGCDGNDKALAFGAGTCPSARPCRAGREPDHHMQCQGRRAAGVGRTPSATGQRPSPPASSSGASTSSSRPWRTMMTTAQRLAPLLRSRCYPHHAALRFGSIMEERLGPWTITHLQFGLLKQYFSRRFPCYLVQIISHCIVQYVHCFYGTSEDYWSFNISNDSRKPSKSSTSLLVFTQILAQFNLIESPTLWWYLPLPCLFSKVLKKRSSNTFAGNRFSTPSGLRNFSFASLDAFSVTNV